MLCVASPQRGEMFIAWQSFLIRKSSVRAQRFLPALARLPGFAPNGAETPWVGFVAINISLRWSENAFAACISIWMANDNWTMIRSTQWDHQFG